MQAAGALALLRRTDNRVLYRCAAVKRFVPGRTALAVANPIDNDSRTSCRKQRYSCSDRCARDGAGDAGCNSGGRAPGDRMSPAVVVRVEIDVAVDVDVSIEVPVDISVDSDVSINILIAPDTRPRPARGARGARASASSARASARPTSPALSFDRQRTQNENDSDGNGKSHDQFPFESLRANLIRTASEGGVNVKRLLSMLAAGSHVNFAMYCG